MEKLFVALATGLTGRKARRAIAASEKTLGLERHPVGSLRTRDGSEVYNNKAGIQSMSDPHRAISEVVLNSHEGTVLLRQMTNSFEGQPSNPREALEAIARQQAAKPEVFMFVNNLDKLGEDDEVEPLGPDEGPLNTIVISDLGCGIPIDKVQTSYLALMTDSKATNALLNGTFGIGSKAVLPKARGGVVFYSRSAETPHLVAFTYLDRARRDGWKNSGLYYEYISGPDDTMLVADLRKIPADLLMHPDAMTSRISRQTWKKVFIGPHGVTVRLLEYPVERKNLLEPFNRQRENLFGLAPVTRYVTTAGRNRGFHLFTGLRYTLRDSDSSYKTLHHEPPFVLSRHHVYGETRAEIWCRDGYWRPPSEATLAKDPSATPKWVKPVTSTLSDAYRDKPTFVTLNEQTHVRLRTAPLLEKVGLGSLAEHLFIEVVCDGNGNLERMFTANREQLDADFKRHITEGLVAYLKADAESNGNLAQIAEEIAGRETTRRHTALTSELTELANALLDDPLTGALFGSSKRKVLRKHGPVLTALVPAGGTGGLNGERTMPAEIVPVEPPTFLLVRKATIGKGRQEWFSFATDAPDGYPKARIILPPFLTEVDQKVRRKGKGGFLVSAETAPEGATGVVSVQIDLPDGKRLVGSTAVEVVQRIYLPKRPDQGKQGPGNDDRLTVKDRTEIEVEVEDEGGPQVNPIPVHGKDDPETTGTNEPIWTMLASNGLAEEDVAFRAIQPQKGVRDVYINQKFGPLLRMLESVPRADRKSFRDQYNLAVAMSSMYEQTDEAVLDDLEEATDPHRAHLLRANTARTVLATLMLPMLLRRQQRGRRAAA